MSRYEYLVSQYPEHVVFLRERRFYMVRKESAYLMNHLFGFRMYFSQDILCTGCPPELMEKVTDVLKKLQINYIVVNHDVLEEQEVYTSNAYRTYQELFQHYEIRREADLQRKKQLEWSKNQINTLIHTLEKVLQGENPQSNQVLVLEDLLDGPVHESLNEILVYLRTNLRYGGRTDQKAGFTEIFYLNQEKAMSLLSKEELKITEFTSRMNQAKDSSQRKRLGASTITNWLLNQGYLMEVTDDQNRTIRVSTPLGESVGIITKEQESQRGKTHTNWYNYDAQRFLVEHLMMF